MPLKSAHYQYSNPEIILIWFLSNMFCFCVLLRPNHVVIRTGNTDLPSESNQSNPLETLAKQLKPGIKIFSATKLQGRRFSVRTKVFTSHESGKCKNKCLHSAKRSLMSSVAPEAEVALMYTDCIWHCHKIWKRLSRKLNAHCASCPRWRLRSVGTIRNRSLAQFKHFYLYNILMTFKPWVYDSFEAATSIFLVDVYIESMKVFYGYNYRWKKKICCCFQACGTNADCFERFQNESVQCQKSPRCASDLGYDSYCRLVPDQLLSDSLE